MGGPGQVHVSVIIPTHNRAGYLREAIDSVLAQTYPHFELIVVDDNSTDQTPEVLAGAGDHRLRSIRLARNSGPAMARNVGICHASGDLVAFLDDDDAYCPEFLAHVVKVMDTVGPEVGFCWCGIAVFRGVLQDENRAGEEMRYIPSFADRELSFRTFWTATQPGSGYGLTVRRACFARVGLFDSSLRTSQDTDLLLRLAKAYAYVAIPEVLVRVREHSGERRSRHWSARAYALDRIYAKHARGLAAYPRLRAGWLVYSGSLYYRSEQVGAARQRMAQAARMAPGWFRTWRLWAAYEWHYCLRLPLQRALGRS